MDKLNVGIIKKAKRPERILQFGEGVFLRAFADEMIDKLNESGLFDGSIVVVPPTPRGSTEPLNSQDCLYTVLLRGLEDGGKTNVSRVVTSISRAINAYAAFDEYIACARNPDLQVIISNTTEAGIAYDPDAKPDDRPQLGFPAKIAAFLYERYTHFAGDSGRGLAIVPCELIDRNGAALRECVLRHAREWGYGDGFINWVCTACGFTDTLVDRIVVGYPADEKDALAETLGYEDALLVAGEPFHFWAIRPDKGIGITSPLYLPNLLPFDKIGLNVLYTDDVELYSARKVRLLNGAHTSLAVCAIPEGFEFVGEAAAYPLFDEYLRAVMFDEAPLTMTPELGADELDSFAKAVLDRFANPFIKHKLAGIMLNATSKLKVRLLPTIAEYNRRAGKLPKALTFALAAFIAYYRDEAAYAIRDDAGALEFYKSEWDACAGSPASTQPGLEAIHTLAAHVLANTDLWGIDLNAVPGLTQKTASHIYKITTDGITAALRSALDE